MDDSEIIRLYFARSERAIRESRDKYGPYCAAIAYRILASIEDTEECVSDTWHRAWEAIPPASPADLRAYLLKAVKYTSLNVLDRRARRDLSLEDAFSAQEPQTRTGDETFAAACANIDEARLLAAIESLPERYRDALYCRFVLQLTAAQTARAMGQSLAATKKQIQRGKQKLLTLLRETENDE